MGGKFEYRHFNPERMMGRLEAWPEAKLYFENMMIRGLVPGTIERHLCDILSFFTFCNRPLERIGTEDVHKWLLWTRKSGLKPLSFSRRVSVVKSFLKGINRDDLAAEIPHIRFKYQPKTKILTIKDIRMIIDSCNNELEEAIIRMLWDTGCRIGEIITLRKKNIVFDDKGIYLIVTGKTGTRPVRLINCVPEVEKLYNKIEGDDDLLFGNRGYNWAYWIFRRASVRLGKSVHPHMFRHTKATMMWKTFPDAIVKIYLGFSKDSKMANYYNHLSPRDVDDVLLNDNQQQQ